MLGIRMRMKFNFKTGFGKWIHTKRFDSSVKSQILSTSYSNRKLEIIRIGFVYTYFCFFAGGIRSYSQFYGKSVLQTLFTGILGSRAELLYIPVFNLIALLTILPLAYLLYKNPGPLLYIIPSP